MPGRPIPGRRCWRAPRRPCGSCSAPSRRRGIKIIDPAGQPFDPDWHEAMAVQESREQPANTVLSVIQKGYSLNGRLLRPARVIVSKAPDGAGQLKMHAGIPQVSGQWLRIFRGFSLWVK